VLHRDPVPGGKDAVNPCDDDFEEMESRNGRGGAVIGALLLVLAFAATLGGLLLIVACCR
jgi:hypothetical protein